MDPRHLRSRAEMHHALADEHRLAIVDSLALSDRTPSELRTVTGLGSNLLAFHLDVLEDAGLIERRPSEGDRRRRYVRLLPAALPAAAPQTYEVHQVLFVCSANSARSQLAAALWQHCTGRPASSAGTDPAPEVHPLTVEVARAHGLELSGARPRSYADIDESPDLVVSVCDRAYESGPPADLPRLHWSVHDPVGGGRRAFEIAFAEIERRISRLAERVAA